MKVFFKSSPTGKSPVVVATYSDDADVPPNAHGPGVQMVEAPQDLLTIEREEDGTPLMTLPPDWRTRLKDFKSDSPVATMRELIGYILSEGADPSKWTADAKQRLEKIKKGWPQP
jgi:hypothetical protein